MNTPTHTHTPATTTLGRLLEQLLPSRLAAVIELDAELAELQELDRRQRERDRRPPELSR